MGLDPKTVFYIFVGSVWAIVIIFWRKLKKIAAHFWSVLVRKNGRKSDQQKMCTKFFEKIGQKLVKWPLSAHF